MKFNYNWKLSDLVKVKSNGLKVFSCFGGGGGSSMGYKMSGFDVLGCNEIDPKMAKAYQENLKPERIFVQPIQTFKERDDLPKELYDLDILDGSPPCSSFSISGSREKGWQENKKFKEGQAKQILDDLFFHYIDLAKKLRPKVIIAENVKGLLMGNAKGYVKQILNRLDDAGYHVQLFLLNGMTMGLPQKRERVFFVCSRKDLNLPHLDLMFNEKLVNVSELDSPEGGKPLSEKQEQMWQWCQLNDEKCCGKAHTALFGKRSNFNTIKLRSNEPSSTVTAGCFLMHWRERRFLNTREIAQICSFPADYIFQNDSQAIYQMGMSVPPLMTHRLSQEIYKQWFEGDING